MKNLFNAMQFLNVAELRRICEKLGIVKRGRRDAGKIDLKPEMISRILALIKLDAGKPCINAANEETPVQRVKRIPRGTVKTPISEDSLMIKGEYLNNAESRAFFKQIIGNHFRFTVFGLDWLKKRWATARAGLEHECNETSPKNGGQNKHDGGRAELNPPTFREFAEMWKKNYELKKTSKEKNIRTDKPEWAYINFVQRLDRTGLSHKEIIAKWKEERQKQLKFVLDFLKIDL